MGLYTTFKTDENLETSGVDLDYGMNSKGKPMLIKVARAGGSNKAFQKAMAAKTRPLQRQIQTNTASEEVLTKIIVEVYAETVILGWSGIEDQNDNEMEFSKANVIKLFTDLPDLFADVRQQAQEISIFRSELMEAVAKN